MKTKDEIEQLATDYAKQFDYAEDNNADIDYIEGYNQCQKDNADEKYTEEDLINFAHFYFQETFTSAMQTCKSTQQILQEWFNSLNKQDNEK